MLRSFKGPVAALLFFVVIISRVCWAAPVETGPQTVAYDQGRKILENARVRFTESFDSYTEATQKFAELVKRADSNLQAEEKKQKESVTFLQNELTAAIDELYQVETEIAIIPEVVKFNEKLVAIAAFFRQQSGMTRGDETLPCGENGSCIRYQNRRNGLAHMIASLADDLKAISAFAGRRGDVIKALASEIDLLRTGRGKQLAPFGLDYYFSKRIALLEAQEDIVEDSRRIARGTYIDGTFGRIGAPCFPGRFAYTDIIREVVKVNDQTASFQYFEPVKGLNPLTVFNPSKWAEGVMTPIRYEYDGVTAGGIRTPGWIDNWQGCYATKLNILNDVRNKVINELNLGNGNAAQRLDEQSLPLEIETAQLFEQKKRVEEAKAILDTLRGSVFAFVWTLPANAPWYVEWKDIVRVQLRNFARVIDTELHILVAGRALVRRAISEFLPLGGAVEKDQLESQLFTLMRRLETISDHGFSRLRNEVALSTNTMMVMSVNIKGLEGQDNEGGLGETILTFENSVKIRQAQMLLERDQELPQRRDEAAKLVASLEAQLNDAVQLLEQVKTKKSQFGTIKTQTEAIILDLKEFFAIKVAHPLYLELARDYGSRIAGPPAFSRALSGSLLKFIKNFSSFTQGTRTQSVLSSGLSARAKGSLIKRAKSSSRQMIANISSEVDEKCRAQLSGRKLSEMVLGISSALQKIDSL
jgi:hypothetical protein